MTWVKLDDGFPQHPKVVGLTDRVFRAHVIGLCYAARYLTDGWVPPGTVAPKEAAALVAAGLWHETPATNGWWINDFLSYNRSREDVNAEREAKKAAGRAGGKASAAARAQATASAGGDPPGSEVPNPRPVPVPNPSSNAESDSPAASESKVGSHIPDRWPFFIEKLTASDDRWKSVTIGACVKLAQETDLDAVSTALSFAAADPPSITGSPYGWLKQTAHGLRNAAVTA